MILALSIFLLLISLFSIKVFKGTLLNICSIYVIVWSLALGVSSLGLYKLYIPSDTTYLICFISLFIFLLVSLSKGRVSVKFDINDSCFLAYQVKYIYIYIVHLFIYLLVSSHVITAVENLQLYGFGALRDVDTGQSTFFQLLMQWIVVPVFSVTTILGVIHYIRHRKVNALVILGIIDTLTYSLMYGGRYSIFRLLFFLVFSSFLFKRGGIKQYVKDNRIILILAISIVALLVVMTSLRSLSGFDFTGNIVAYYTGSIGFMDQLISRYNPELCYGTLTFGSLWNTLNAFFRVIFGVYYGSNIPFEAITAESQWVGQDTIYNSLCTYIYPYIMDYGIYLFWIGVVIFALFVNFIEKKLSNKKTLPILVIYIFVAYTIFNSLLANDYIYPNFVFVVFFTFFFIRKKKLISVLRKNLQ